MAYERISCPNDGATTGVKQVGPDQFFCSHCKSLFRYVDQRRFTFKIEDSFCPCGSGNRVEFQCQLCRRGICRECDALEWQRQAMFPKERALPTIAVHEISQKPSEADQLILTIPVNGFGYLEAVPRSARTWVVASDRIASAPIPDSGIIGPFLHLGDFLPQLTAGLGRPLHHVCCQCLTAAAPSAAEDIAAGRVCEYPECTVTSDRKCRCCGNSFCAAHVIDTALPSSAHGPQSPMIATVNWSSGTKRRHRDYLSPDPNGTCGMCASERLDQAIIAISELEASYPKISNLAGYKGQYQPKPPYMLAFAPQFFEDMRQKAIAREFGALIEEKIRIIENGSEGCRRQEFFTRIFEEMPDSRRAKKLAFFGKFYRHRFYSTTQAVRP